MRVEVYNNRGTLKGSTLLGYKNISLDECYKNSSKWMYNKIERLEIDGEELKIEVEWRWWFQDMGRFIFRGCL